MKKKKLLGILPSYSAGGAEKIMITYFQNYEKRPFFLKLLILNKLGPLKTKLVDAVEWNYKRLLYAIPKILFQIKKNKFSVVYSTFPHITLVLIITKLLKLHSCYIVVRQPNMLFPSLNYSLKLRIIRFLYIKLINLADIIIVTSQAMRYEALQNNFNKKKIFLLPNPIDVRNIRKKICPAREKGKEVKLVFVGRLSYQKGLDRVLSLFSKVENLQLSIVGKGPQRKPLERLVEQNKLQDQITFCDFIPNPYNIIAGADYLLLPSRWEGMPNCVLESLALGTPVIAFKEISALNDFSFNIKNKTIILVKNEKALLSFFRNLRPRKDKSNPILRKSLLRNPISEVMYRKKLDKVISDLL